MLVDGSIDLLRHVGREETVVARMDEPGRWAGGFRAWDEAGTYLATGRGARPGRVLRVPAEVLRDRSTTWFPFGGHLIRGLYHTARSIESTVRQRESLVTLGTLAAGLAHEINNPAAAATRSVDALQSTSQTLLSSLARLAHDDISAAQFAGLDELRREIEPRAVDPDPLARADREQDLGAWLSRHAVPDAWRLAPALAAAGIDPAWCARVETILGGSSLEPALEWVASTFSLSTVLGELKESTRRISELVAAMRSYSQLDRASLQKIQVADGLETTLVMLSHKLSEITVERDYGADVTPIEAYAGELNQVWTNLIDNAIDAMDGEGTLRVSTRNVDDGVSVEIADTGSGMPPRWLRTRSRRSTPRRTSARAPASAWTSPAASWSSGTAARSPSTRSRAAPCCGSNCPSDRQTRKRLRGLAAVCAHNGPNGPDQLKPATACGPYGCSSRATSSSVSSISSAAIASSR